MEETSDPDTVSARTSGLTTTRAAPLYEQVRRQISEMIMMGEWPPGTVLPSEVALAQDLSVSIGTVRRALTDLTREGLLARRRKTGTVVTGRAPPHSLRHFFHYFRLHRRDGSLVRSRTELVAMDRRPAAETERRDLRLEAGAEVLDLARVRRIDGRAIMHEHLVLVADRLPGFPPRESVPELLYLFLLEEYGIRMSAVREQLSADALGPRDGALLDIGEARAVLVIEEVAYDQTGRPVIRATHRAVTDMFTYVNEIS